MGVKTEDRIHNGNKRPTSPLPAIKAFCLECCGGDRKAVADCQATQCPLWCFKDGKNPYRKDRKEKNYTEEQKKAIAERMKNARNGKRNANV